MNRLAAGCHGLSKLLGFSAQLALATMVVTICYDVVARYAFAAPTLWSLEVNTFLVVFLALAPAGEVLNVGGQLKITFLTDRMPRAGVRLSEAAASALGLLFSALMTWQGWDMAWKAWQFNERMSTSLGTPMCIPYFFIPLGFGVLGLEYLIKLLAGITSAPAPAPAAEVKQQL